MKQKYFSSNVTGNLQYCFTHTNNHQWQQCKQYNTNPFDNSLSRATHVNRHQKKNT